MNTHVDQRELRPAERLPAEFLDAETEARLARAWREAGDERAMHRLVTAHRKLAQSMARKVRHVHADREELVQQAHLGLIRAAQTFDPDRGFRFATYAAWWVRSHIQDHLIRSWSLVRMSTTAEQKSVFFNFRRLQARLEAEAEARGERLGQAELHAAVVRELGVPADRVEGMVARMAGPDVSLNVPQGEEEDGGRERIDTVADEGPGTEQTVLDGLSRERVRTALAEALSRLPERERHIVVETVLREDPPRLEDLGAVYGISRERVRQLREQGLARLRRLVREQGEAGLEVLAEAAEGRTDAPRR